MFEGESETMVMLGLETCPTISPNNPLSLSHAVNSKTIVATQSLEDSGMDRGLREQKLHLFQ